MAKFLKTYEILLKKAQVDFNMAKLALDNFEKGDIELDLEVIMFHLQQCAEKIIKSYLDFNNIQFPRSHDLKYLVDLLQEKNLLFFDTKYIDFVTLLTQYAVEGRYAVIHDDIQSAEQYLEFLAELIKFVKEKTDV